MSGQPEPEAPASRWWRYATEDLEVAQRLAADGTSHRWVAVLAQQAAEKAVKALLIEKGVEFPRTHDVLRLVRLLPAGLLPEPDEDEVDRLSAWAVAGRYPADLPDALEDDAHRALSAARAILDGVAANRSTPQPAKAVRPEPPPTTVEDADAPGGANDDLEP